MPSVRKEDEIDRSSRSSLVTLDLSGRGIRRIDPLPDGVSPQTILYNNNNISRIENLQFFAHLQQLSLANNHLVEMNGISQAQGLKVLDLSNNSIITIEGLTHLRSLEWLNLSGNSIKRIQNLEKNINLCHLDISDNRIICEFEKLDQTLKECFILYPNTLNIIQISSLRNLTKLKVLLLHGNLITSLKNVAENVPESSIVTLSLAENEISDLNELNYLRSLTSLEQLSIAGNPCLLALPTFSGFNYRPYILYNCPRLYNLDSHVISQSDRLEADRLRRDGKMRTFSPGRHSQLVTYLSQATPLRPSSSRGPPTPNFDRVSSSASALSRDDEKWSVPVLEDKHSTEARDLDLEDISPSESDDQLVSESCYVPVNTTVLPVSQYGYDIKESEDWYTTEVNRRSRHGNHEKNWSLGVNKRGTVGVTVERDPDMETDKTGIHSSQYTEDAVTGEQDNDVEPPIMTEEEAFGLINLAATIIQAHVRGFLVRRKMLFSEYRHRNRAATLIQATWKGYRTRTYDIKVITVRNEIRARRLTAHISHLATMVLRCQEQAAKDKKTMAKAIKCLWNELEKQNDRNVARLAREQNNAAVTIQRLWKGYRARKMFPISKSPTIISYQSLAVICQNLQKQVDLLKSEVEDLKSGKNRREGVVKPPKLDRVKSTPEIRITRPSICLLPEHHLEVNQALKCERSVEDLLSGEDEVQIEPLDLGKYDSVPSVCDTTFAVENATELESKEDATSSDSESRSNVDESNDGENVCDNAEDSSENVLHEGTVAKNEPGVSNDIKEKIQDDFDTTTTKQKDVTSREKSLVKSVRFTEVESIDSCESQDIGVKEEWKQEKDAEKDSAVMAGSVVSEDNKLTKSTGDLQEKDSPEVVEMAVKTDFIGKDDISDVVSERKVVDEQDEIMVCEKAVKKSEMADDGEEWTAPSSLHEKQSLELTKEDNLKTNENGSSSPKEEKTEASENGTCASTSQSESQSADTSTSDGSPSPLKPESIVGRKKKKLLLRSSSAEAMPRIRSLHSSHSLDSEHLSSSLNFSSRLGQRTAALLLELRSEIASLTARQLSDDYYDTQEFESVTTKGQETESSKMEAKDCETITDSSDPTAATTKPLKSTSDSIISDIKANAAKNLQSSDSGISCQDLAGKDPEIEPKRSDSAGNDMRNRDMNSEVLTQNVSEKKDSETVGEKDFSGNPIDAESVGEHVHVDSETGQSNASAAEKFSPRPSSFTMPVFEDIEKKSFSIDDYMEDSLEHSDD